MALTRLAALNATLVDSHGHLVRGVGVLMDCPCGADPADHRLCVPFTVAVDGQPWGRNTRCWERTGDTIDTLTLSPSVQAATSCQWHGWIRDGAAIPC